MQKITISLEDGQKEILNEIFKELGIMGYKRRRDRLLSIGLRSIAIQQLKIVKVKEIQTSPKIM